MQGLILKDLINLKIYGRSFLIILVIFGFQAFWAVFGLAILIKPQALMVGPLLALAYIIAVKNKKAFIPKGTKAYTSAVPPDFLQKQTLFRRITASAVRAYSKEEKLFGCSALPLRSELPPSFSAGRFQPVTTLSYAAIVRSTLSIHAFMDLHGFTLS